MLNGGGGIHYKLYVLHTDITEIQIQKLHQTIASFQACDLEFITTKGYFEKLWENITSKHHFSKEIFYKFIASSIFPQYEKIIISDVDVVFLDDVSESFLSFNPDEKFYIGGIKANDPDSIFPLTDWKKGYQNFSQNEFEAIQKGVGAGYLIANLKQMRQDNIEEKLLDYAFKNAQRLILPEQDTLNIICYPYIKGLSPRHMVSNRMWELYGEKCENLHPKLYSQEQINEACNSPIQLHYAGEKKPWKYPNEAKSSLWFYYIAQTPFHQDFLNQLPKTIIDIYKKSSLPYRIKSYLRQNPFFLLKPSFYQKIYRKLIQLIRH